MDVAMERSGNAPVRVSFVRRVFFGADGLRAGWSLLLFIAFAALMQSATLAVFKHLHRANPDELRHIARYPYQILITNGIPFVVIAIATILMSRIEGRPIEAYGIGRTPGAGRQFLGGMFWGAAALSLPVLALWRMHLLVFDGVLLSGGDGVRFGLEWMGAFLLVGLFEESSSRGFVQFTIARGLAGPLRFTRAAPYANAIGFWIAAVWFSYSFGAGHSGNTYESRIGLIAAGVIAFVFCVSLWRTGSLWWAIGAHASWDWAQSFVFGVADSGHNVAFHWMGSHPEGKTILSGGLVGPEGSLLVFGAIAVLLIVVLSTLPNGGWPVAGSRIPRGEGLMDERIREALIEHEAGTTRAL